MKNNKKVVSGSKNNGCIPHHHFVQVGEPTAYGENGHPKTDKPRPPRLYCVQCATTVEIGA